MSSCTRISSPVLQLVLMLQVLQGPFAARIQKLPANRFILLLLPVPGRGPGRVLPERCTGEQL